MTSKADYLKKYLSTSTDKGNLIDDKKKKKKKKVPSSTQLTVAVHDDDDALNSIPDWLTHSRTKAEEDEETSLEQASTRFKPPSHVSWETVRESETKPAIEDEQEPTDIPSSSASPPPRRRRHDSSEPEGRSRSPPRRRRRHDTRSPSLGRSRSPTGLNPHAQTSNKQPRSSRARSRSSSPDARRMTSGVRVGLQRAQDVQNDIERFREKRMEQFQNLDSNVTGRGASTIYRDKSGKKIDITQQQLSEREERRKKEEEEARNMEWGKGLVQRRDAAAELERIEREKNLPLNIYKDNKMLNEELKQRDRWNDPAAPFLSKKKPSSKGPVYPKYKGPAPPPNRFKILPGYRWDGVDRSNGFEREYFQQQTSKAARVSEAYSWSVEDM